MLASKHQTILETEVREVPPSRVTRRTPTRIQRFYPWVKRGLDVGIAVPLLLVLSPVLAFVALLIFLADGRPILYRRRVVGQEGEFDAFKFRTMCRDADAILAADAALNAEFERNFKLKRDPRVTRLGLFLRKLSLDELPQLLNVALGQMSLVGPRMVTAAELSKYGPNRNLLLSVKPGLTGYWQVNGRQNVPYDERVGMDLYYVRKANLTMDLKILVATPFKVLKREGAH